MRCRYHALLQIVGFLAVVAFHAEVSAMSSGWFAVELFFALAGYNMAGALHRRSTLEEYAWARYRRLVLPLLMLLPAVLVLVATGSKSAATYAVSAPLQLHNLLRVAMTEPRDLDMAWMPTWFVAALFQLQLLAFVLRRVLVSASVSLVLAGAAALGVGFRLVLGELLDGVDGSLTFTSADALYWAPLTHVEALVGGLQLGLGRLSARRLYVVIAAIVALPLVLALATTPALPSLAFPLGLGNGGEHIWGYLLLAGAAVVLIDKRQPLARWVLGLKLRPEVDRAIFTASQLTFVAYLAHGSVLALLTYVARRAPRGPALLDSSLGPIFFTALVGAVSLLIAAAFGQLVAFVRPRRTG